MIGRIVRSFTFSSLMRLLLCVIDFSGHFTFGNLLRLDQWLHNGVNLKLQIFRTKKKPGAMSVEMKFFPKFEINFYFRLSVVTVPFSCSACVEVTLPTDVISVISVVLGKSLRTVGTDSFD